MGKKSRPAAGHSGQTDSGNTRDVKVERVGPVTIYKRGLTYYLYYREAGVSRRQKVEGNLAVARATASKVASARSDGRPSPIGHKRTSPRELVAGYLAYITDVRSLALRTQDRYRAALDRLLGFCQDAGIGAVDAIDVGAVEDFVKWLRGQTRARNGASKGKREVYKTGGIKFILSTCRTAFNWAGRRRMLPPFAENPFAAFPIDGLRDRDSRDGERVIFAPAQEEAFFEACDDWQRAIFVTLATYGLRVGELTHLLVEDVDLVAGSFRIRSKPELFWSVKTGRTRELPLVPKTRAIFEQLIGERKAGFVFLRDGFASGKIKPPQSFATPEVFLAQLKKVVAGTIAAKSDAGEREKRRGVMAFCRTMGQIPEKRVREEFMKLTTRIGCPEFTRVHDLRHLFTSRAQEAGMNPLLVQDMLGHATLDMTRRYTHLGIEAKREAMRKLDPDGDDSSEGEP
jgi:integrase